MDAHSPTADAETFPALVQASRSNIRVVNRGIGGHGSVQNYLQFRRDLQVGQVQTAVFGVISDHRYRNIPHPQRMRQLQKQEWYELGVEHIPVARQNRAGDLVIDYVPIWQPGLERRDFDDFLPNEYMIDQATVCVLQAIATAARQKGIPVIFALLDQLDQGFNETVLRQVPQAVDISVPLDEKHTFMPRDIHPNDYANQIIADRLLTLMHERFSGELGGT